MGRRPRATSELSCTLHVHCEVRAGRSCKLYLVACVINCVSLVIFKFLPPRHLHSAGWPRPVVVVDDRHTDCPARGCKHAGASTALFSACAGIAQNALLQWHACRGQHGTAHSNADRQYKSAHSPVQEEVGTSH